MKKNKTIMNSLDKLWSKVVRTKANNKCEYCGKETGLNAHHIFSRSNKTLRWDSDNGVSLCVSHHVFGILSAHKAPIEFIEWLKEKRGEAWYDTLRIRSRIISKNIDYAAIRLGLECEIKVMEDE